MRLRCGTFMAPFHAPEHEAQLAAVDEAMQRSEAEQDQNVQS